MLSSSVNLRKACGWLGRLLTTDRISAKYVLKIAKSAQRRDLAIDNTKRVVQMKTAISVLTAGMLVFLRSGAAVAQSADVTANNDALTIPEIIVTAQRRAENLSDVPISVQQLSAAALETAGIVTPDDLQQVVPGLTLTHVLGNLSPYIRGIGTTSPLTGVEPAVSTYIDGVYQPAAVANILEFNNIASVEVLKGPQGTLYGRNATGGLISITTRDPSHDPSAEIKVGYGNYDTVTGNLYDTTGISSAVAADIAVYYHDQGDGFGRNLTTGAEYRRDRETAVRTKWLIEPSPDTSIRIIADHSDSWCDSCLATTPIRRPNDPPYTSVPFYDTLEQFPSFGDVQSSGISAEVDQLFSAFTLKSISAYRYVNSYQQFSEPDLSNTDLITTSNTETTLTQELQLASKSAGAFSWIGGLFFMHDISLYNSPDGFSVLAPTPFGLLRISNEGSNQGLTSYSAYLDGGYKITDATKLTLGVRYTDDNRNFSGQNNPTQTVALVGGAPSVVSVPSSTLIQATSSDSKVTYRAVLDHRFSESVMVYGSYSTGFKSGGFLGNEPTGAPLQPETISAEEVGAKLDLADRRVRLSTAAFNYNYDNLQVTKIIGDTPISTNAAKSKIDGAEIEGEGIITSQFSANFGVEYLNARYTSFPGAQAYVAMPGSILNELGPVFNAAGNKLSVAPDVTTNVGARYTVPIQEGALGFYLNYYFNSGFSWAEDERVRQSSYNLLNGRLDWKSRDEKLTVGVWGKNLTNAKYYVACRCAATSGDDGATGPPLTYGVDMNVKF
jgi:iron complex outermembrane recepter protein